MSGVRGQTLSALARVGVLALLLVGCSLPGGGPAATVLPVSTATAVSTAPPTAAPSPTATLTSPATATAGVTATTAPSPGQTQTVGLPSSVTATPTIPAATATVAPTAIPLPPTMTLPPPTATAPSAAPKLTRLTGDACCAGPRWLADGSGIYYYGYGGPGGRQLATWAMPRAGGTPRSLGATYGTRSPSGQLVATRQGAVATVAQADGAALGTLTTGAALLFLAPTDDRIAWLVPDAGIPQVSTSLEPPARVRVATIGPGGVGAVRTLDPIVRAEVLAWLPDGRRIVLSTRDAEGLNGGIAVLDTETGAIRQIVAGNFLESLAVSPDGTALIYTAVLQPAAAENGVWYVRLDGGGRRKLPITGGYRWLPDSKGLVFIPAPSDQPTDDLRRYSLADGAITTLVPAQSFPFKVSGDDWELAPDGRAIVFRSATDGAIWVLEFGG